MKRVICEVCGSSNVLKSDGVFVCQDCGMQYDLKEAKNLLHEVSSASDSAASVSNPAIEFGSPLPSDISSRIKENLQEGHKYLAIQALAKAYGSSIYEATPLIYKKPWCDYLNEDNEPSDSGVSSFAADSAPSFRLKCPYCRTTLTRTLKFCTSCGSQLIPLTDENISAVYQLLEVGKTVSAIKLICSLTGTSSSEAASAIDSDSWRTLYLYDRPKASASEGPSDNTALVATSDVKTPDRSSSYISVLQEKEMLFDSGQWNQLSSRDAKMIAKKKGIPSYEWKLMKSYYDSYRGLVSTSVLGSGDQKKLGSAVGRAAVGGFLLGPVGLAAGLSAKSAHKVTFALTFKNGRTDTVTADADSTLCKFFLRYLDKS